MFAAFNGIFPAQNLKLSLTVNPMTTNVWTLPGDFSSADFAADSSLVATQNTIDIIACRFNKMLDFIFTRIPDIEIVALQIGNELDHTAQSTSSHFWANYWRFYANVATHARAIQGGLEQLNNTISDIIALTYYPMNGDFTVKDPTISSADIASLVSVYTDVSKPIHLQEVGYHTGSAYSSSSQSKQGHFIQDFFQTWDHYDTRIAFVSFLRLNDLSHSGAQILGNSYYAPGTAPPTLWNTWKLWA
ncbi:MAG: hypothetical protein A2X94_01480 [Bdellovibrionales bacterium GWB1_55_8]|nr:MAG: hypothetical protein A2X94_01480 [Bdellovibrionales bacterium GWB1_55_8]